jgi:hypothetical protein
LLFPAFAPAARAGFRLLPERTTGRAAGRESLRGALPLRGVAPGLPAVLATLEWPLRLLPFREFQAAAEGLVERVPEAPLAGRAAGLPFPLERLPLADAAPAWAPLRLPFVSAAALGLQ